MPSETELESMIVRLVGDGSSYQKMMEQAVHSSEDAARHVEEATKRIEHFTEGLKGFGEKALGALEVFGAGEWLRESFTAFGQMERGQIRLNAAIESGGHDVKSTSEEYKRYAAQVSETTLITKGATMKMLEQAETMGFTGKAAEHVVNAQIALGKGNEEAAIGMGRAAAQMERGNLSMVKRMLGLRDLKNETELHNRVQAIMNAGMKIAHDEVESTTGKIEHLGHSFHALFKDLGEVVAKVVNPVVDGLKNMVDKFKELDKTTRVVLLSMPALAAALLGIGPVIRTLWIVLSPLTALFSPLGIAVGVAGIAIYGAIQHVGGLAAAWDLLKQKFSDGVAVVERITSRFINWKRVGDDLKTTFDAVKLVFNNFGLSADLAFVSAESALTNFAEHAKHFFVEEFPRFAKGAFKNMSTDAKNAFDTVTDTIAETLVRAQGAIVKGVTSLLPGDRNFEAIDQQVQKILNALRAGREQAGKMEPIIIPEFQSSEGAKKLAQNVKDLAEKLAKAALNPKVQENIKKEAEALGVEVGNAIHQGAGKGTEKIGAAVAAGSVEALNKIAEFRSHGFHDVKDVLSAQSPARERDAKAQQDKASEQRNKMSWILGQIRDALTGNGPTNSQTESGRTAGTILEIAHIVS